jgi:ATP-dependent HslUV protease, peptidase subunit HslV
MLHPRAPISRVMSDSTKWHGTTILSVRKGGKVVIAGDGQVSMGQTVMKPNARKVRPLGDGKVITGLLGRLRTPSRFLSGSNASWSNSTGN